MLMQIPRLRLVNCKIAAVRILRSFRYRVIRLRHLIVLRNICLKTYSLEHFHRWGFSSMGFEKHGRVMDATVISRVHRSFLEVINLNALFIHEMYCIYYAHK